MAKRVKTENHDAIITSKPEIKAAEQDHHKLSSGIDNHHEIIHKDVQDILETDLSCAICQDIYINPLILNCSHSFCKFCVYRWLSKKAVCPQCRMAVSFQAENLALRNIINKMVQKSSPQFQSNRTKTVKDRLKDEEEQAKEGATKMLFTKDPSSVYLIGPRRSTRSWNVFNSISNNAQLLTMFPERSGASGSSGQYDADFLTNSSVSSQLDSIQDMVNAFPQQGRWTTRDIALGFNSDDDEDSISILSAPDNEDDDDDNDDEDDEDDDDDSDDGEEEEEEAGDHDTTFDMDLESDGQSTTSSSDSETDSDVDEDDEDEESADEDDDDERDTTFEIDMASDSSGSVSDSDSESEADIEDFIESSEEEEGEDESFADLDVTGSSDSADDEDCDYNDRLIFWGTKRRS